MDQTRLLRLIVFMVLSPKLHSDGAGGSFKLDQIYDNHGGGRHNNGGGGGGDGGKLTDKIYDSVTIGTLSDSVSGSDGLPEPHFVTVHSGNVTAILGKTAILNCRVTGIGNRTVSWIRHKDTHLLTAGRYTYTSDMRFRAIHKVLSQDYLLQILPVKSSDGGLYECQVSTTPVMSHHVFLNVAEPITEILGGPNIYLEEGNNLNLTCVVRDSPEPPQYIFWYRNTQPISHNTGRDGVSLITEKADTTISSLMVNTALVTDSGQYACHSSVGSVANVTVHVIRSADPEKWLPSSAISVQIQRNFYNFQNIVNFPTILLTLLLAK